MALKNSGATVALLRNSGCSLSNLLHIFSISELIGIGVKEARLGDYFSVQELLRIGIEPTALINAGVKCIDMRDAGKTAKDLTGMYSERELGETFSAEELVEAGFKAEDLVKANFPLAQIRQCGFGVKTLYSSEAIQNKRLLGLFLLGTHPNSGAPYLTKFRGSSQSIVKRKVAGFRKTFFSN